MTMSLMIIEVNYSTIDDDYSTCRGYYIIILSSSQYTLRSDLNIDGQVIYSGEMVCEGNYYFPINTNFHCYFSPKNKPNHTIIYVRTIINGIFKVICYDLNGVVKKSSISISQKYFSSLTPIHVPM